MSKVVLGYWAIRGIAQTLRLLLNYTNTEFEQAQHTDFEKWFKEEKLSLGLDFPNLPYLIDGDFKLTESTAIAKYIIHRSGNTELLGRNVHDQGQVENILGVFGDINKDIAGLFFNPDHENAKAAVLQKHRAKLDYIKHFVGNREFALGYLTLVDFQLGEYLNYFETLFPNERHHYAFWWRIRKNLNNLPGVQSYYHRKDAIHGPFFPPGRASLTPRATVRLGYWGIRGLGQIPRLLLSYSGVEFEDVRYSDSEKWFKGDKLHLGLDFPNLPYLIDGDYNVTESTAIQRYIIRRWGKTELLGNNAHDNARIESFLSVFVEASNAIKGLFWNQNHATERAGVLEKYAVKLDQLEKYVGERTTVLGYLTLADFVVAEDSTYIETVYPEEFKRWSFLHRIREHFSHLPEVVAYYARPTALHRPYFSSSSLIHVAGDEPVVAAEVAEVAEVAAEVSQVATEVATQLPAASQE